MDDTKILNEVINKKKEYKGIDICKFLMAIMVVAIHTSLYSRANPLLTQIYDLILSCAVPFFFLASGFFLYNEKNQESKLKIGLKKIIKLYIMWNIIYLPIAIYYYVIHDVSFIKAVLLYIKGFLFVGEHYLSWQLWYLLSFIYSLIVILILKKMKLSDEKILIFSFGIYMFGIFFHIIVNKYGNIEFVYLLKKVLENGRLFTGMFLIFTGLCINKYKIKLSKLSSILMIALCVVFYFIYPNEFLKLILFIAIFLLAMQINNIKIKTINFRKSSMIIYFMHMWNVFILLLTLGPKYEYGVWGFCINLAMCIIESIVIICIQNKWNFKFINELFNWSSNSKK